MPPLNLAVAFQIMNNIKNGQLRNCLAMGIEERDLQALIDSHCMGALVNSPVPWFKVVVNGPVLHRLLAHLQSTEEEELIRRAIILGSSSPMILELFGLCAKEVSLRRSMLGIPHRKGRWPLVGSEEEISLWEHWGRLTKEQGTDLQDPRSVLKVAMQMTECVPRLNLAMVWSLVQSWITEGLV
ncbi:STY4526/YPO1902 family pathogenicity island replication protein [Pseudomonas gingeri]